MVSDLKWVQFSLPAVLTLVLERLVYKYVCSFSNQQKGKDKGTSIVCPECSKPQ